MRTRYTGPVRVGGFRKVGRQEAQSEKVANVCVCVSGIKTAIEKKHACKVLWTGSVVN